MSEVVYENFWYNPISLVAKDGKVTLLGHHYVMRKGINVTLTNKIDAYEFDSEATMAEAIRHNGWAALPQEADGKPQYVPKRLLTLKRKYELAKPNQ